MVRIIRLPRLQHSNFVLVLNKKDLFARKIDTMPISVCPELAHYAGAPHDADACTHFIADAFRARAPQIGTMFDRNDSLLFGVEFVFQRIASLFNASALLTRLTSSLRLTLYLQVVFSRLRFKTEEMYVEKQLNFSLKQSDVGQFFCQS